LGRSLHIVTWHCSQKIVRAQDWPLAEDLHQVRRASIEMAFATAHDASVRIRTTDIGKAKLAKGGAGNLSVKSSL
jgi:hypothetical protein